MPNETKRRKVKKRRLEIMSNIINAEWELMTNDKKPLTGNNWEYNKRRMGHHVEWQKCRLDPLTKCRSKKRQR
jgi:hypothetical protein